MRYLYFISLQSVLCFALLACSTSEGDQSKVVESTEVSEKLLAKGLQVMETQCFACHSPEVKEKHRIAPSFQAIKEHYMKKDMKYPAFYAAMQAFLNAPSEQSSKMPHAVEKFGLMPKMSLTDAQIKAVTTYLYYVDLKVSNWHQRSPKQREKGQSGDKSYIEKGMEYAMATKAVLGKNLMTAIQEKGTEGALSFCNERAIPLTDSMQQYFDVHIQRVSDKNRNPNNQANEQELAYIKMQQQRISEGEQPKPLLTEGTKEVVGYYPIMTNQMCLQCHGKANETLKTSTLSRLKQLYPKDKATGYEINQLRGIWVVKMPK